MLDRALAIPLHRAVQPGLPVLVQGPRAAGKTTLLRREFPGHAHVSLDEATDRIMARQAPERFLARLRGPAVIDDLHRAPELIVHLANSGYSGPLLLASSRRLRLPCRTFELHPPTRAERQRRKPVALEMLGRFQPASLPPTGEHPAWAGGRRLLETDVRDLVRVHDTDRFEAFLATARSFSGEVLDQQRMAREAALSHRTVTRWLAVLDACFLILRLPAWDDGFGRRLIRGPKFHFLDGEGLESQAVSEIFRNACHSGTRPDLGYWRDSNGLEIPLVVRLEQAPAMPVCIAEQPDPPLYARLHRWMALAGVTQAAVIGSRPAPARGKVLHYALSQL